MRIPISAMVCCLAAMVGNAQQVANPVVSSSKEIVTRQAAFIVAAADEMPAEAAAELVQEMEAGFTRDETAEAMAAREEQVVRFRPVTIVNASEPKRLAKRWVTKRSGRPPR